MELRRRRQVLLNKMVLDLVAKNLPLDDLLTLRLTCGLWNSAFADELSRSRHREVRLDPSEESRSFERYGSVHQKSLELLGRPPPFTRFLVVDPHPLSSIPALNCIRSLQLNWLDNPTMDIEGLRRILFEFTPNLVELNLVGCCVPQQTEGAGAGFFNEIPNLKKLRINCFSYDQSTAWFQFLVDLIRGATMLECLWLQEARNDFDLARLRDHPNLLRNLKELNVQHLHLPVSELRIIMELVLAGRIRLQTLRICLVYATEEWDAEFQQLLQNFLVNQGDTLERLMISLVGASHLGYSRPLVAISLRIPKMERLTCFELKREGVCQIDILYEAGGLSENFPLLQRFEYDNYTSWRNMASDENLEHDMAAISTPAEGVTELELNIKLSGASDQILQRFGHLFPRVTRLHVSFWPLDGGIRGFAPVWTTWPATLTRLHVRYNSQGPCEPLDLDELLTGVPPSKFKSLARELEFSAGVEALLAKYKTKSGIQDLKHLQKFKLEMQGGDYKLSDIGGYLVFAASSPTLQRFQIVGGYKTNEVTLSKECMESIRNKFGPHFIISL